MGYFYIGDEYKNLIGKIFKYELMMEICISQILMIELAYQKLLMNIWEKKVLIQIIDCLISRNPSKSLQMLTMK